MPSDSERTSSTSLDDASSPTMPYFMAVRLTRKKIKKQRGNECLDSLGSTCNMYVKFEPDPLAFTLAIENLNWKS